MGANATTFVPAYVAGEVLTAADLSVTNSGIPVFATTVTRDAAFGGTGEKVLAEGQFAYIEATNTFQYYDSSGWITVNLLAAINSAQVLTSQATSSTSYVDLSTVGPSVTLTTGTSAIVSVGATSSPSVQGPSAAMSFAVSGATTIAASNDFASYGSDPYVESVSMITKLTTLTAGSNTFTAKYKATSGTATFFNRSITVWAI
jgi:hypothetical protein